MTTAAQGFLRFDRLVSVHRFVRAATRDDAVSGAMSGVWLLTGPLPGTPALIEQSAVHHVRSVRYCHADAGSDLWWVAIDVKTTVLTANSDAASEAARWAVALSCTGSQLEMFAPKIQVLAYGVSPTARAA